MNFEKRDGVFVSAAAQKRFNGFEEIYIRLRENEGRQFSVEEIKSLPAVSRDHPHFREWRMRAHTISRFENYLAAKRKPQKILDTGCGNGFFSKRLAQAGHSVTAVDINMIEMRQAVEAFGNVNPVWYFADIMQDDIPGAPFDLIVFHASFQYFSDPGSLLKRCFELLAPSGSVHILETPVYPDAAEAANAYNRAAAHFEKLKVPGMKNYYRCLSWDVFRGTRIRVRKKTPGRWARIFRTISPFPWIEVSAVVDA